ncbi:MAG: hypothetical protein ACI9XJ_000224, partial [Marivirga sp.]
MEEANITEKTTLLQDKIASVMAEVGKVVVGQEYMVNRL